MSYPYLTDLLNAVLGTQWQLPIPTFGVVVAIAMVVAARVARAESRRIEALGWVPAGTQAKVADLALVCALAGLIGARFFHVVDNLEAFGANPAAMILSRAGFSIYGGLCFGIVAGAVYLKRNGIPVVPMLDATAPSLMLGYAIGRLGCQLAGDGDWGIAANMALKPGWLPDWAWAQTYDGNILGVVIVAPGVYPTPLYEAAAALALFGVLWALRPRRWQPGFLFSVYLVLAGFERLLIEKIRVNPKHEWLGMEVTQAEAISLAIVAVGLLGLMITLHRTHLWRRALIAAGVATALAACAPL